MSLIADYLRSCGTLDELSEKYALTIRRHPTHANLVLFKYDQVFSRPEDHPFVVEARGLILDEADNYRVINWPFERFFNYGQACADTIDLNDASVLTKMDGSCLCLWNYRDKWHCSTTGSAAAEGTVYDFGFTFANLFWKTFKDMGLELFSSHSNLCFMFELTSIYNKIVVQYPRSRLTLIGVRNRITGEELLPEEFLYPQVKSHKFNDTNEMMAYLKDIPAVEMEGFVVRSNKRKANGSFSRIKLKSEQYIRLHHIKSAWSIRNAVSIIVANEQDEIKLHCPEYAEMLDDIATRYNALITNLETTYSELKHLTDKKEFALALQARKPPGYHSLYMLHASKVGSIKEYLAKHLHLDSLIETLGLKTEKANDHAE